MLIDTSVTIAYKCTFCGSFEFFNISLFTLLCKKDYSLSCRCKMSHATIKQEGENSFLINIPCIGCENEHTYLLKKSSILLGEPIVFSCPETDMPICFTGRDEAVRRKVDNLEEEFDDLMDTYGYESYFNNTQVMFDTLNCIHDIALKGNLYCECGSEEIDLVLLSDCILLRCEKCACSEKIPAAKNKDLKDILSRGQILLTGDVFHYNMDHGDSLFNRRSVNKIGK